MFLLFGGPISFIWMTLDIQYNTIQNANWFYQHSMLPLQLLCKFLQLLLLSFAYYVTTWSRKLVTSDAFFFRKKEKRKNGEMHVILNFLVYKLCMKSVKVDEESPVELFERIVTVLMLRKFHQELQDHWKATISITVQVSFWLSSNSF